MEIIKKQSPILLKETARSLFVKQVQRASVTTRIASIKAVLSLSVPFSSNIQGSKV